MTPRQALDSGVLSFMDIDFVLSFHTRDELMTGSNIMDTKSIWR